VPAFLKTLHRDREGRTACIFTIHNLLYQGIWGREVMAYSGLPWSAFTPDGLEFYGSLNCLKAGIVYSERVNTVSPTYAREIQTAEHGHGLDGLLHHSRQKLSGIVNGIDYDVWNPLQDSTLPVRFGPGDLEHKAEMKRALLKEVRLPAENGRPLFSFVGRLVDQKGMNLIMANLGQMLKEAQLVILGTGDAAYHERLSAVKGNGSLAIFLKYDEDLAHRIYAGSDAFLMPSWFEPCGLGQLIALRYGTLPVVRRTGGLSDTVRDADRDPHRGTGFAFEEYRPEPLADAFRRTLRAFHDRERWQKLVEHAMAQDFSWEASTVEYEELYRLARG